MSVDVLTIPVVMLGLAILLAMLIERLLEIARSAADYYELHYGDTDKWTIKAEQIRSNIELRLDAAKDSAKTGDGGEFNVVMSLLTWYVQRSAPDESGAFVISADKIRKLALKVRYRIYAVILGIACAWLLQIDVVELVKLSQVLAHDPNAHVVYQTHWHGLLMAGVAMGLGAGPMHKIITALEDSRKGRVERSS